MLLTNHSWRLHQDRSDTKEQKKIFKKGEIWTLQMGHFSFFHLLTSCLDTKLASISEFVYKALKILKHQMLTVPKATCLWNSKARLCRIKHCAQSEYNAEPAVNIMFHNLIWTFLFSLKCWHSLNATVFLNRLIYLFL